MMLFQKPQPALSSPMSMSMSHRRQASAPILVQPTRIPGLLSLSKPPRSSPPRNQQRHNTKSAPRQPPMTSVAVPTVVRAHAQTLAPAQINTAPATPSPQSRGRPQEKHSKDKILRNKRSASQSSLRASGSGKHNGRQPSPPILSTMAPSHKQKPSQAEVPVNFFNSFDPFVDQSSLTPSPSPRKQSKAIPVPAPSTRTTALARSDPLPFHSKRHSRQQRPSLASKRALTTQEFPICDDMSEIVDADEPSTPVARRLYEAAPLQLAPISNGTLESTPSPVPLSSPSPQNKNGDRFRTRRHRRTPSEGGVFHMSSDEEVSSGPGGAVLNSNLNPNVKALFGLLNSPAGKTKEMNMTTPARAVPSGRPVIVDGSSSMNMSTSVEKAAFFASSLFQNSPSPDELPDPLLL